MPDGYLVTLGDGKLDPGDVVSDPIVTFTTDTSLGAGSILLINATFNGTFFASATGSGTYILGTDGNVYFVPDFDPTLLTSFDSLSVNTSPAFDTAIFGTAGDDAAISGTGGADLIYGGADRDLSGTGNDTITAGGGDDTVFGGDGDDSILGNAGNDLIEGGLGSDTLAGGANDDTIYGDGGTESGAITEALDWTDQGGNGTDLSAGFTQNTGLMDVTVSFSNDGNNAPTFEVDTQTNYTEAGEPFDTNSSLEMFGQGDGATSTTTLSFAAATPGAAEDEVSNVQFRINDIDFAASNHRDIVEIVALDADGNPVPVTFTVGGGDTVSGNTITADDVLDTPATVGGSVLINIAGPVSSVAIVYSNGLSNTQAINITDVYFDAQPISGADDSILGGGGNDQLFGGAGADTLRGGAGDDTLSGGVGADLLIGNAGDDALVSGAGDTTRGGDGDDTFTIDTDLLTGDGITIIGGEGDETDGDTLDFGGLLETGSIVYTNTDDAAGGLSGTATLTDGTSVTFSEIETIICFTAGTAIQTPSGERRIETLKAGDLVLTLDNGPKRIRWIGQKTVRATGALAPIRFSRGSIGNHRDLLVSPQHRMLCGGYLTQLHFGESEVLAPAKSLVDELGVTVAYGGMVTYYHMLFDAHEIVIANGAPSESFYPGGYGLDTLSDPARDEIFRLFPHLRSDLGAFGPISRVCVKPCEARALLSA